MIPERLFTIMWNLPSKEYFTIVMENNWKKRIMLQNWPHKGQTIDHKIFYSWISTACKRSLTQGNVFTPVCLSTEGRGGVMMSLPVLDSTSPLNSTAPDSTSTLLVSRRAVRMLMECFLVLTCVSYCVFVEHDGAGLAGAAGRVRETHVHHVQNMGTETRGDWTHSPGNYLLVWGNLEY